MAIIIGKPVCAICESNRTADYTATSGCAFLPGHHLFRYCDAPLHLDCLATWSHRIEFSEGYYFLHRDEYQRAKRLLAEGENWVLVCGPSPLDRYPYYAEVRLRAWPMRLYSRYEDWNAHVSGGFKGDLSGQALDAAEKAMREVAIIAPDLNTLEVLRRNAAAA